MTGGGRHRRPAIGIAMDVEDGSGPRWSAGETSPFVFLKIPYVERVVEAGGFPLLLPLTTEGSLLDEYLDRMDGLLLTGSGIDIHAAAYGHEPHPRIGRVLPSKSEFELRLATCARERAMPFLGICNGMQVMNVAYGGTLYQDLMSERGVKHDIEDATKTCHAVRVERGTRLAVVIGEGKAEVNSSHHQAVRDVGKGLVVAAVSDADGLVEAIEDPAQPFALGVQWHPELIPLHAGSRNLFAELVRAAARKGLKLSSPDA